jgi:hypothetical protein
MVVKDLSKSGSKFATNAGNAAGFYKDGVQGAGAKWKAGVENSEEAYNQGVQNAISRGAFKKGVAKAGADYYTSRAVKLGGERYTRGVQEGAGNWQEGYKPYADALSGLSQSPKGPKGDPRNAQRSLEVQIALRKKKEELA